MANLGFDIDDVIFKSSDVLEKILDGCSDLDLLEHKLDILRGEADNKKVGDFLKSNVISIIKEAVPMDGVADIIKTIKKNNRIILITARNDKLYPGSEKITIDRLNKYGIEYDDIIFNCMDKVNACKDNNIDLFIDDSPKNCLEVSKNLKIPVIGFLSNINKEEMIKNNIRCVASWNELYKIVTDIEDNLSE